MDKEIIISSGNKRKIKEVQEILEDFKIIPMENLGIDIDVEEDKETFEENAIKKAKTISDILQGKMVIADDSGIEIEYLNGFPGIHTKRWMEGSSKQRNKEILNKLKNVPKEQRQVRVVSSIAIVNKEITIVSNKSIEGYIAEEIRGNNGFGFDEIIELENGKTLAQISKEEKNEISARRKALEDIKKKLIELNEGGNNE